MTFCDTESVNGFRVRQTPVAWRCAPGYLTVAAPDGRSAQMGGPAAVIWQALPAADEASLAIGVVVERVASRWQMTAGDVEVDVMTVLSALEAIGCADRHT